MEIIRSYTDLEQSKTLAKILPLESADMFWKNGVSDKYIQCFTPFVMDDTNMDYDYDVHCWSLAALLGVLPYPILHQQRDGAWGLDVWVQQVKPYSVKNAISEVDACYKMILKLNELKML